MSAPDDLPTRAPTAGERDRAVEALVAHFARDHLELAELERRLDRVYAVRDLSELASLTSDLPDLPAGEPAAAGVEPGRPERPAPPPARTSEEARSQEFVAAVMGGSERGGRWTPARRVTAFALMGGVELDFRDAVFASDVVDVTGVAIMGGIGVVVPPGVRVEVNGLPVMGAFEKKLGRGDHEPDAPLIRVGGLALMGGVEVTVRLPGETEKDARQRLKEEERARKEARRARRDAERIQADARGERRRRGEGR